MVFTTHVNCRLRRHFAFFTKLWKEGDGMIMVFFVDYGLRSKLMIALVECMYQAISQLLGRVLKRETFDS